MLLAKLDCFFTVLTLGKLVVAVNREAIWFEFWMKGAFMIVESFVFCCWWFSNLFDIMSKTSSSCDAVDSELWLVILSSLLCPETDWNIRIGQQGCVFILTDFEHDVFMFPSWHQSFCQQSFWDWEKLNFLNKLTSKTFCLLGFVRFEIKQWFSSYQHQLCLV